MKRILVISIFISLAGFYGTKAQNNTILDSLQNLLKEANQTDSAKYLLLIGEQYFIAENYSKSLDHFFPSLKRYEAKDDLDGIADASNNIGRVYYNMDNFEVALGYFSKALNYYEQIGDETSSGGVLNNLALIYYELDSIDLAIVNYQKALVIKEKFDDTLNIAAIYHNLGLVYINQKNFSKAIENLVSSRNIFLELGHERHAANTANNIGLAYYKNARYNEALQYFKKALIEAKKVNSSFLIMDNYKYQADCYAKMGLFKSAYSFSNKYYVQKDSLLNIDKEKEIAEIQAKYSNEIKEQENNLLKKENETKEATIRMQYLVGIGIIIISILAGFFAVIYYRANQTKMKVNDLLIKQKVVILEKNDVLSKLNKEISNQNKEILEQKKELEELNGIKDKLFSIISHEFRSPLNSLKGTLTLMKAGAISDSELEMISKDLTDKINSTSIFLDNLLNWAKSQMQGISARPVIVELKVLAEENIQLLKSLADKKKIRIKNKIPDNCKAYIDPNMMNLIFKNLISNAIKFSLKETVIEIYSEMNSKSHTISIKDSGVGISSKNIKLLFQLQSFTTRGTANERGTGLGLYITKNFVESNGGEIWVESVEGSGSIFKFTVPI